MGKFATSAIFIAADDIYKFDASGFTPIAGQRAKKSIFADLANATSPNAVQGFVVSQLGPGFDFLSYWLTIPGPNVTWIYHHDEDNWVRFTSSAGSLAKIANLVVT
jgi:hypothetical protein